MSLKKKGVRVLILEMGPSLKKRTQRGFRKWTPCWRSPGAADVSQIEQLSPGWQQRWLTPSWACPRSGRLTSLAARIEGGCGALLFQLAVALKKHLKAQRKSQQRKASGPSLDRRVSKWPPSATGVVCAAFCQNSSEKGGIGPRSVQIARAERTSICTNGSLDRRLAQLNFL